MKKKTLVQLNLKIPSSTRARLKKLAGNRTMTAKLIELIENHVSSSRLDKIIESIERKIAL